MPSLAMWGLFLSTAAWAVSTSTTGAVVARKQLTSVGIQVTIVDTPKL